MRDLFQVTYKVDSNQEEIEETLSSQDVTMTCVRVGCANYNSCITYVYSRTVKGEAVLIDKM